MSSSPLRKVRSGLAVVLTLAALGMAGCGPSTSTVSGKVFFNNVPLKGGNVTLVSSDGRPSASGGIAEDGSYTVRGIGVGTVKICVETESLNPKGVSGARSYSPPAGGPVPEGGYNPAGNNPAEQAKGKMAKLYVKIPEKYSKPDSTDLTLTVTGPKMDYDIQLK